MTWLTNNWRLKLASLVLCVALLGAVAFSENPITFRTVSGPIHWGDYLPAGVSLIGAPPAISVQVSGLKDDIASMSTGSVVVVAPDLAHVTHHSGSPPQEVAVNLVPHVYARGVSPRVTQIPTTVRIDSTATARLPVEVRTPHVANGWEVKNKGVQCPNTSGPCFVTVRGPESVAAGLKAYVSVPETIAGEQGGGTVTVQFEQNGKPVQLRSITTYPQITIDPTTVQVSWTANHPTQSRSVALVDSQPNGTPAAGYHITNVTINPSTIVVTGPGDALATLNTITVPAVDIGGATGNVTRSVRLPPLPDARETTPTKVVTVTYVIQPNPNVSPPPSPTVPPSSKPA